MWYIPRKEKDKDEYFNVAGHHLTKFIVLIYALEWQKDTNNLKFDTPFVSKYLSLLTFFSTLIVRLIQKIIANV
jgi:hypothetical protein